MDKINLVAKFAIQEGKKAEFKSIAEQCIKAVKKNELGITCSQYNWFFNANENECHVLETYANSDAVMIHMGNVGELLGKLLQISSLQGNIYGDLSEELQSAFNGLDVKKYSFFGGA